MIIQFHGLVQQGKGISVPTPPPPPPDEISVSPTSYNFSTSGGTEGITVVTSTGSWTATKTSDPSNIIESFTDAGNNGDTLYATCITNSTQHESCAYANIHLVRGEASCDMTVSQDGTVETC